MKSVLYVLPVTFALSACGGINNQNSDEALAGAIIGGTVGAVAGEDRNRERNIAIGAAVGAAAGATVGNNNDCRYRNTRTGEVFTAPCGSY